MKYETLAMRCTEEGNCLLWNQGVNNKGYPQTRINGATRMVRRYVYTELMGKEVNAGRVVSTKCNNKRCISKFCLVSKTPGACLSEAYRTGARSATHEYADRLQRAIKYGMSKLSAEIALHIRTERLHETNCSLAREYGVHAKTIASIKKGKSWKQRMGPSSVFSLAQSMGLSAQSSVYREAA